jgi:hypothetical protein
MLHPNYSMKQIITKEMILKIRYRAWTGEYPGNIQKDYNFISTSTFYDALGGKTWKNLSIPPYDKNKLKEKICTRCGNKNKVDKFYKWTCNDCVNEKERIKTKEKSKDKIPKSKKQLIFKIYPSEEIKKEFRKKRIKERNKSPVRKLQARIRKSIRSILKAGPSRGGFRYLNYTKEQLYEHLYKNLLEEINLEEYHIDHIVPVCSFDPKKLINPTSEEFKKCWALENLRLIKSKENLQKSKYDVLMKFRS